MDTRGNAFVGCGSECGMESSSGWDGVTAGERESGPVGHMAVASAQASEAT